jgi:Aspartyl protease
MMRIRSWTTAASIATLLFASYGRAMAVDTIPFTEVNGGQMQVQASVDGKAPVPMLIDLGAGVNVLSSDYGGALAYGPVSKYTTFRLKGDRLDLQMRQVVSLSLGSWPLDDLNVGIWKGLDGTGVDGLISAMAFRRFATTFDFRTHQIVIEDAQSFFERKRNAQWVPIVIVDDRSIGLAIFAKFDFGNGQTGLCQIDTGSPGITLDRHYGTSIPSIALAQTPGSKIVNPAVTFADLIYDCNIGNSFWKNRALTLDIPERAIFISTN